LAIHLLLSAGRYKFGDINNNELLIINLATVRARRISNASSSPSLYVTSNIHRQQTHMNLLQISIIIIVLAGLIFIVFRRKKSLSNIDNPKIILLQIGTESQLQLDSDKTIYSDFYSNVTSKTINNIQELKDFINSSSFDLFHLFVDIDKEGNVFDNSNDKINLGELIDLMQTRDTKYIFFAKDNPSDNYINGPKGVKFKTNTVMTLARKGNLFSDFFKQVFSKVSKGKSFPVAWNEIAPQGAASHDTAPDTFAVMGAGNLVLLGDK